MTEYFEKARKATFTTLLLLPAIGTSRRTLAKFGFVNGYLDDKHHEVHYEQAVYLLFRPESWEKFEFHLKREQESGALLEQYDYAGGYIVLVYKILDKYLDQYKLFMQGKYSKFSKEYQEEFPKFLRLVNGETGMMEDKISLQWHIINKTEPLKKMWEKEFDIKFAEMGDDMEVWGLPTMERETLDITSLREPIKLEENEQE
jgi:hypothetical protein